MLRTRDIWLWRRALVHLSNYISRSLVLSWSLPSESAHNIWTLAWQKCSFCWKPLVPLLRVWEQLQNDAPVLLNLPHPAYNHFYISKATFPSNCSPDGVSDHLTHTQANAQTNTVGRRKQIKILYVHIRLCVCVHVHVWDIKIYPNLPADTLGASLRGCFLFFPTGVSKTLSLVTQFLAF